MPQRISIALCTCDGLPYLKEQLASYLAQERRPDEVVISDDASTDGTPEVVREFQRDAPFEVRAMFNPQRLGVSANFSKAVSLCTSDLIFLSDQDDVWLADKLSVMEKVFDQFPGTGMVFGDLEIVDENLRPLGETGFQALGFDGAKQKLVQEGKTFEMLLRYNVVSGAAMGFRGQYRDWVVPVGPGWVHDEWIAFLVAAVSEVKLLQRPLVQYRQHGRQQIGLRKLSATQKYEKAKAMGRPYFERMAVKFSAALQRLGEAPFPLQNAGFEGLIEQKLEHARLRLSMRDKGAARMRKVWGAWQRGDYSRFDYGWKSAMQDLFLP